MKTLLNVESKEIEGKHVIGWQFGKEINAYYLIGVLEVIKQELIDTINDETKEGMQ